MIKDYQNSLERTIAGMVFGKTDTNLDESMVAKIGKRLNKLKMEDYIQLTFLMEKQLYEDVKKVLGTIGITKILGFPTMEAKKPRQQNKPRNPMAVHAIRKGHQVIDQKAKDEKKDRWSRNAKHKDKQMKKIEEGILGMGPVPVVGRLRELAGIKTEAPKSSPVQEKLQKLRHIRELEDFEDVEAFDAGIDSEIDPLAADPALPSDDNMLDNVPTNDFGVDDDFDDVEPGFDDDMGLGEPAPAPITPAVPSFAASLSPELTGSAMAAPMAPVAPAHSPAFDEITSGLTAISTKLADVKVSEYKDILAQLKQVHQQVRDAGFNYLQESRKKKR